MELAIEEQANNIFTSIHSVTMDMSFGDTEIWVWIPTFLSVPGSKLLNFAKNYFFFTTPHGDKIDVAIICVYTLSEHSKNVVKKKQWLIASKLG